MIFLNLRELGEGESLAFKSIEGSFGAVDRKPFGVVYLWGYSLKDKLSGLRN